MSDRMIGIGGMGISGSKLTMPIKSEIDKAFALLPLEERELRITESEKKKTRKAQIYRNVCPSCEGKLSRGEKDKQNGYMRSWKCNVCGKSHTI